MLIKEFEGAKLAICLIARGSYAVESTADDNSAMPHFVGSKWGAVEYCAKRSVEAAEWARVNGYRD